MKNCVCYVFAAIFFMDYKYSGIILDKKDVGETDRIYTIFTLEAGKLKILGKGVKKSTAKLAGQIEPVTLAEIFIAKGRGMGKITGAVAIENFAKIKKNYEVLQKVYYVFRFMEKLIGEEQKDAEIFHLLSDFLREMEKHTGENDKSDILALGFLFKLFSVSGYRLEAECCAQCEKKLQRENNCISLQKGGVLCQACQSKEVDKVKISPEAIKLMRIFQKNKIRSLAKLKVPAKDIINLKIIIQEALSRI